MTRLSCIGVTNDSQSDLKIYFTERSTTKIVLPHLICTFLGEYACRYGMYNFKIVMTCRESHPVVMLIPNDCQDLSKLPRTDSPSGGGQFEISALTVNSPGNHTWFVSSRPTYFLIPNIACLSTVSRLFSEVFLPFLLAYRFSYKVYYVLP
jgi:hypothetical protein